MGLSPVERQTILIVDDEEGVRSILARWLESTGYRIVSATEAEAAPALGASVLSEVPFLKTAALIVRDGHEPTAGAR